MNKFKAVIKKISPFVNKYKWSFFGAILFIISAAVFTAIAPRTEGLIITQLTKDFEAIIKGVTGASVNFNYIIKTCASLDKWKSRGTVFMQRKHTRTVW